MKLISWNVNGLRAAMKKGFMDFFNAENPDIICLQETKMQEIQKTFTFPGYYEFWNDADKKGYSGTLIITKDKPLNVTNGIDGVGYNDEGRIITAEYEGFYLVNVYVPNTKKELARLDYRMTFDEAFRAYLVALDKTKPVILCGDLNVANEPIDLKNPKANERNAGYTIEERNQFKALLKAGFTDTFRTLYPEMIKYSWWSYMFNARKNNAGWRIDYFVISDRLVSRVEDSEILNDILGSDHCPVKLTINV
ncbi:MAG: exodeoxyribonuclease III [Bacillota bacterium]